MGEGVTAPGSTQGCPETPVGIAGEAWGCNPGGDVVLLHELGCKWDEKEKEEEEEEEEEAAHPLQCLEGDTSRQ